MINNKITLSANKQCIPTKIHVVQGENKSRKLEISIADSNGQLIDIDQSCTAIFYIVQSKTVQQLKATISNNKIFVTLTSGCVSETGVKQCWIQIIKQDQYEIRIDNLVLDIQDCNIDESIEASDNFSILVELISDVKKIQAQQQEYATAETQRQKNEQARQSKEQERQSAETTRVQSEDARKSAELGRVNNENGRVNAEKLRVTAESNRVKVENSRVSAESVRVNTENERKSAESGRVTAESKRVSAESTRVSAESKRQTDTASAIKGCNDIKTTIENKLNNGEFNGKTILSGGGVPSSNIGKNGDIYIETQGTGQYPYYLFIKENNVWKQKWAMRGINGQVVNSLSDNSTINAPSVRVVKEQLDNKANKIVLMNNTASEIIKPIELAFKIIQDSGSKKIIQIIDKITKDSMFPEVRWEHVIDKNVIEQEVNTIKDKLKKCIFFK